MKEIKVIENNIERLDSYLSNSLEISRSKIQKLIKQKKITVNEKLISPSYQVKEGDVIRIDDELDFTITVEPENIPLDIVYEDDLLMIINKQSGMVVHPAPGNYSHTLVNALLHYLNLEKTKNIRPGIVHRLDKDTSGLMVVAKNEEVLEKLSNMMKEKKIKRHYLALVEGIIGPESATIDAPIGRDKNNREKMCVTDINSKEAITHIKVLERYAKNTLIECILETGRTHQIRVHLSYIKHPVINDPVYSNKKATKFGQFLHSKSIDFYHPITKEHLHFEQPIPEEFKIYLEKINKTTYNVKKCQK